jgi:hypothetical protein
MFMYINLAIYFFGYFVPLVLQMHIDNNPHQVFWLNTSCLVVSLYVLLNEFVQLSDQRFKEYFCNLSNLLEVFNVIIYIAYYITRLYHPQNLIPKYITETGHTASVYFDGYLSWIPLVHIWLIVLSFQKLMTYLRCNEYFGALV